MDAELWLQECHPTRLLSCSLKRTGLRVLVLYYKDYTVTNIWFFINNLLTFMSANFMVLNDQTNVCNCSLDGVLQWNHMRICEWINNILAIKCKSCGGVYFIYLSEVTSLLLNFRCKVMSRSSPAGHTGWPLQSWAEWLNSSPLWIIYTLANMN